MFVGHKLNFIFTLWFEKKKIYTVYYLNTFLMRPYCFTNRLTFKEVNLPNWFAETPKSLTSKLCSAVSFSPKDKNNYFQASKQAYR